MLFKFKNVAIVFGKTHVTDEQGMPLYLNELDIDSETVYDILDYKVLDNKGVARSLIDQSKKITYVVKTKKPNGFHIFWLSHTQNKPIGHKDCNKGFEL